MSKQQAGENRSFLLGTICVILAIGALSDKLDYAFVGIATVAALYVGNIFYNKKKQQDKEKEKAEREKIERFKKKGKSGEERAGGEKPAERTAPERDKKHDKNDNIKAAEIKGEAYAKTVGEAMKRLHYDIEYRKNVLLGDDAVHLTAYRANEVCLVHCVNNAAPVQSAEIAMFIRDCDSFVKRSKFWQDDIKYVFAISGEIDVAAIAFIDEERKKRNTPIEYKVFGIDKSQPSAGANAVI